VWDRRDPRTQAKEFEKALAKVYSLFRADSATYDAAMACVDVVCEMQHERRVSPHVNADDGGYLLEYWATRSACLTITVEDSGDVDYLIAWGPNINTQMSDGRIWSVSEVVEHWDALCQMR
jgi:hypothetical protein